MEDIIGYVMIAILFVAVMIVLIGLLLTPGKPKISLISNKDLVDTKNIVYATKCSANWQVIDRSGLYIIKCRDCGTILAEGGTPKCLKDGKD